MIFVLLRMIGRAQPWAPGARLEVWCDGMEVSQFMATAGWGIDCNPVPVGYLWAGTNSYVHSGCECF